MHVHIVPVDSDSVSITDADCKLERSVNPTTLPELLTSLQACRVYVWWDAHWKEVVGLDQLSEGCKLQVVRAGAALAAATGSGAAPSGLGNGPIPPWAELQASLATMALTLPEAVANAVQRVHRQHELTTIDCSMSNASFDTFGEVVRRVGLNLIPGGPFPKSQDEPPPAFKGWPTRANGKGQVRQVEAPGYVDAIEYWQQRVAPAGVAVVLKDTTSWLKCEMPERNLNIKDGKTDALCVLEEDVHNVVPDTADLQQHLLLIVGQVEYKTTDALQTARKKCMAQAGLEHVCATLLQDRLIRAASGGLANVPQASFVTVMTDNCTVWVVYRNVSDNGNDAVLVTSEPPAGEAADYNITADAVSYVKARMAEAADKLREIRRLLATGGVVRQAAPGHDDDSSDEREDDQGDDTQPPQQEQEDRAEPSSKQQKAGSVRPGRQDHTGGSDMEALSRQLLRQMRGDDDYMRELSAEYHAKLVSFLKSKMGYEGLLERDAPPTTFQLPDVDTLFDHPWRDQSRLVEEAMQQVDPSAHL